MPTRTRERTLDWLNDKGADNALYCVSRLESMMYAGGDVDLRDVGKLWTLALGLYAVGAQGVDTPWWRNFMEFYESISFEDWEEMILAVRYWDHPDAQELYERLYSLFAHIPYLASSI